MFFKLQPLIYSIIFVLALEVSTLEVWFFRAVLFLIVFSILIIWPLARKVRFLAIPFFLSIGSANLLFFIDNQVEKQIFIGLSAVIYYLALLGAYRLKVYDCDQTAQGMVALSTISTIFFWFVSILGWYINFQVDGWLLIITFFISSFFISLPSLYICQTKPSHNEKDSCGYLNHNRQIKNEQIIFLNFVLAFVISQIAWLSTFWPFNNLTTGSFLLIIFYVFYDIIRMFLRGELAKKRVIKRVLLFIILSAVILATAQWRLLV